ncbi:hypothetical protein ACKWTF_007808 [Chironomus riparius]
MESEPNHCEILCLKNETDGNDEENEENLEEKVDLTGDYGNAALLVLLYMFQGLLLGLCTAVPILLQNRGASYKEQALFTLVYYPFSLKVIWAPIIDACYINKFGRRKTWIIPSQILIGVSMIISSQYIDVWMGDEAKNSPNIIALTAVFFAMRFCASVQDCAADGWALCLLKKRNIGHVATCEMVGISAGWLIGYVILLVFESKEFCNSYLYSVPKDEGLLSLGGFLKFWGITFLMITALIAIFKKENSEMAEKLEEHPDYGIRKAYPTLWKVLNLKPVIKFSLFLLTVKVSFAACDAVSSLKLLEYGIPKDKIALMAMPLLPIQILLPVFISRFVTGKYPLDFYIKAFRFRLFMSVIMVLYIYLTPWMISGPEISFFYYAGIFVVYLLYHVSVKLNSLQQALILYISSILDTISCNEHIRHCIFCQSKRSSYWRNLHDTSEYNQ